jgi:hypothetical protein
VARPRRHPAADEVIRHRLYITIVRAAQQVRGLIPIEMANARTKGSAIPQPAMPPRGSWALPEESEDAGFEDFITDREHVIAIRNIERLRGRNECGKWLGWARHLILGSDRD